MKAKPTTAISGVLLLLLLAPAAHAHGIAQADKKAILEGGNPEYLWLGTIHMLTGYDHLLFIFGIIFFLTGFLDIIKYITAFTLGHSITLILATFTGITANYYLVDAVIALSVCYIGFDNIDGFRKYIGIQPPKLLFAIFSFGLIHGFGLSTRLQELPLGESGLFMRIISFNIGVELGQVAALLIMIGTISVWRTKSSFRQFSVVSNGGLIAAGSLLFLLQIHGFAHTEYPNDFGFGPDQHYHAHQQMDKPTRMGMREAQAIESATQIVAELVKRGKLDKTWQEVKAEKTEQKILNPKGEFEWMVTFNNPKAQDNSKRVLYVFLSQSGKYRAANFTGN